MIEVPIIALRYGPPGAGKTGMIPTWREVMKEEEYAFIFDFDRGLATIRNPVTGFLPKGFTSKTFIDQEQARTAKSTEMRRRPLAFKDAVETMKAVDQGELAPDGYEGPPKVVIVDTITGMEDAAMNLALSIQMSKGESFGMGGGPARQHWGAIMRYGDEFFRILMSGDWHIDATAHEEANKDEVKGGWRIRIGITGQKRPSEFPGMFDELYHHEVDDKGRYVIRTRKTGMHDAKSRLSSDEENEVNILPEHIDISFGQKPRGWGQIVNLVSDYWTPK